MRPEDDGAAGPDHAESPPLPRRTAAAALARCVVTTVVMLARHRLHLPRRHRGMRLHFADGTCARVYRETVADPGVARDPCVLVVAFRLRLVRGRGHAAFRAESLLNTPLFVGFPGFVSKLWMTHDEHGVYRGLYEWDGPDRADFYARALWYVLAPVCVPGSVRHRVVPGLRREDLLADRGRLAGAASATGEPGWWRVVEVG
jgi:hypothetical protein